MVELVDTHALGACASRLAGSIPVPGTNKISLALCQRYFIMLLTIFVYYGIILIHFNDCLGNEGGDKMDNSTFKTVETENEGVWNDILEEYRFSFLRYLEVVKELLSFEKDLDCIKTLKRFLVNGWMLDNPDDEAIVLEAGKALYYRYDAEYSPLGFERATKQFEADLSITQAQEKSFWHNLTLIVDKIDPGREYAGYDISGRIWYQGNAETQRGLMVNDTLSFDRVRYYEKELRCFSQRPLLPYTQEVTFRYYCNGLALV